MMELKRKTREELIAEQRAVTPRWTDAMLEPWADSKLRVSFNVLNNTYPETLDWPALVRRITCPVLLIRADPALGGIVTEDDAPAFQALVPTARVAHIPGPATPFAATSSTATSMSCAPSCTRQSPASGDIYLDRPAVMRLPARAPHRSRRR